MQLSDYRDQYVALGVSCSLQGSKALETVKQDGCALRYVHEQTEAIVLEAVKQDAYALQ